jgi:hypothetical protein
MFHFCCGSKIKPESDPGEPVPCEPMFKNVIAEKHIKNAILVDRGVLMNKMYPDETKISITGLIDEIVANRDLNGGSVVDLTPVIYHMMEEHNIRFIRVKQKDQTNVES